MSPHCTGIIIHAVTGRPFEVHRTRFGRGAGCLFGKEGVLSHSHYQTPVDNHNPAVLSKGSHDILCLLQWRGGVSDA